MNKHLRKTVKIPCAYTAIVGPGGQCYIGRADQGMPGHTLVREEPPFTKYDDAEKRAKAINKSLGLSLREASDIVLSTMGSHPRFLFVNCQNRDLEPDTYGSYPTAQARDAEVIEIRKYHGNEQAKLLLLNVLEHSVSARWEGDE